MQKATIQNTYEVQASTLLESIRKGVAPWAKPWKTLGSQRNAKTGRPYNGGNAMYLATIQDQRGFEYPLWLTWKQARDLGGHVKSDEWENGSLVIWFRPDEKPKKDADGNLVLDENGDPKTVRFWMSGAQVVYNAQQTTVKEQRYTKYLPKELPVHERNTKVEGFLDAAQKGSGFGLTYSGDRAYYSPLNDEVRVPPSKLYKHVEEFYSTHLHEFGHATGHKSRLARGVGSMALVGQEAYAEEELVAELTAAFLGAEFQLDGRCQHAEYLSHWLGRLENNSKYFYQAASQAKKAVAYLKKTAELELAATSPTDRSCDEHNKKAA